MFGAGGVYFGHLVEIPMQGSSSRTLDIANRSLPLRFRRFPSLPCHWTSQLATVEGDEEGRSILPFRPCTRTWLLSSTVTAQALSAFLCPSSFPFCSYSHTFVSSYLPRSNISSFPLPRSHRTKLARRPRAVRLHFYRQVLHVFIDYG